MKREFRLRILLLGALIALLLLAMVAPGWGMPDQNRERQTVPALTPQAYLPLVIRNYSAGVSSLR